MKPQYIWLGAAAILLAGGVLAAIGYNGYRSTGEQEKPARQEPPAIGAFLVTTLQNNVGVKDAGDMEFTEVSKDRQASEGATVKTTATGRALIEAPEIATSIVDRNSELVLRSASAQGSSSFLSSGSVWSRVEKVFEQGEYYEIETQNAVASVRGTSFGMSFLNNVTSVLVSSGTVRVMKKDQATGERLPETEQVVTEGKKALITENRGIVVADTTPEDTRTEWYALNNPQSGGTSSDRQTEGSQPLPSAGATSEPAGGVSDTGSSETIIKQPASTNQNLDAAPAASEPAAPQPTQPAPTQPAPAPTTNQLDTGSDTGSAPTASNTNQTQTAPQPTVLTPVQNLFLVPVNTNTDGSTIK